MALTDGINQAPANDPGGVSVTTSTTEIVPAKPKRQWVFVTNLGPEDVFIAIGKPAELNKGLALRSVDGAFSFDSTACPRGAINGITSTGSSTVIFLESD